MAKNLVSGPILAPTKISSLILPLLHVRHCCKLSMYAISRKTNDPNLRKWQKTKFRHVQYQKKLMMQSWENLVTDGQTERRTDGKTDGQTDESDTVPLTSSVQHIFWSNCHLSNFFWNLHILYAKQIINLLKTKQ